LHSPEDGIDDYGRDDDPKEPSLQKKEQEANQFAAELLMPEEEIDRLFESKKIDTVSGFANYFGVSKYAMEIRLQKLRYIFTPSYAL